MAKEIVHLKREDYSRNIGMCGVHEPVTDQLSRVRCMGCLLIKLRELAEESSRILRRAKFLVDVDSRS